ncbi:hypothetical protein [Streptomyces sp. NPDC008122]|uniref:hypothetical protein n=1 Tax=Streptomyces sp. NPDC008122 TaxID=3364810 RepID=UPI0036E43CC8
MTRLTDCSGYITTLLTVIVEALDVPLPSNDDADEAAHYALLQERSAAVRIALETLLEHPFTEASGVLIDFIRERTARYPVTYTPFVFRETGGEA